MRKKGLPYLLAAAMLLGSVGFTGGYVRADEPVITEEGENETTDATATDAEELTDAADEGDNENVVAEEVISEGTVDAEDEASSKWIQDYEYDISGDNIILRRYKGTSKNVYVYKTAQIDGKTYYTLLEGWGDDNNVYVYSIWGVWDELKYLFGENVVDIESISFEEGVKVSENCKGLFSYLYNVPELDLSGLDLSKVTDSSYMFYFCKSLKTVNFGNFTGANVTNMRCMFAECSSLKSLNLSNFNTKNVTNMQDMFDDCNSLESLDLSNFNTKNVTNMRGMFYRCNSLKNLNVSSFDTGNVKETVQMFYVCSSLKELNLSSFDLSGLENNLSADNMFLNCNNLETLYTPRNVGYDIKLPASSMYDARGNALSYIPKNVTTTKKLTSSFTGWRNEKGTYRFVKDGEHYVSEATMLCNGIINNKKNWYAASNGVYDNAFSGLAKFEGQSGWGYAKNGVLDTSFSGLATATNGRWYYVNKGKMDLTFTGKIVKATNGNWYYVSKGRPTKTFTEKIAQTTDGKWYYCTDGRPDLKFSGKIALCTNGNWYYVTKGKIDRSFTGIAEATNGKKYYVENGVLNKNYTGTYKYNGKTYNIVKGAVK